MSDLLVLGKAEIEKLFTPDVALESQRRAFRSLGHGHAVQPERIMVSTDRSAMFAYAAKVDEEAAAVCKFGAMVPANPGRGLPSVSATIIVLDPVDGRPVALLEATTITTLRTAAASAVAVEALARPDAQVLAIIGTGVQAVAHARLISAVLNVSEIRLFGRDETRRAATRAVLEDLLEVDVVASPTADAAVRGADVVLTCTTSTTPVIDASAVAEGALVISVGSFSADRSELPTGLFRRCHKVVVDHLELSKEFGGCVIDAATDGTLDFDEVVQLGDILVGNSAGRQSGSDIIVFNSVGLGVQDAAAAEVVLQVARSAGVGQPLRFG